MPPPGAPRAPWNHNKLKIGESLGAVWITISALGLRSESQGGPGSVVIHYNDYELPSPWASVGNRLFSGPHTNPGPFCTRVFAHELLHTRAFAHELFHTRAIAQELFQTNFAHGLCTRALYTGCAHGLWFMIICTHELCDQSVCPCTNRFLGPFSIFWRSHLRRGLVMKVALPLYYFTFVGPFVGPDNWYD